MDSFLGNHLALDLNTRLVRRWPERTPARCGRSVLARRAGSVDAKKGQRSGQNGGTRLTRPFLRELLASERLRAVVVRQEAVFR